MACSAIFPKEWWSEQRVELLTRTSVTGIDLQTRTARLSTKDEIEFEKLLVGRDCLASRLVPLLIGPQSAISPVIIA